MSGGVWRRRLALIGMLALVLGVTVALSVNAEAKKKGGGKAKAFSGQVTPNAPIPDAVSGADSIPLTSTITVPKKFKGKVVGDVNVTGLQTTGSAPGAANDLIARLTAPNGRTITLFRFKGDQSLGPWTLDDDTHTEICDAPAPPPVGCNDPYMSLYRPFAGTSNLVSNDNPSFLPLATFDGVAMRGAWTLTMIDFSTPGPDNGTSVLNQWGLQITAAKPVTA